MPIRLALKIDIDTDRGTRHGVPNLVRDLQDAGMPASFFFSLGPDNTGRAITRVFRPGFLKKVGRTSVVQLYGIRTLLNGTLLPAPHIGRRNAQVIASVAAAGFETAIHCHDHYHWQDHVHSMSAAAVQDELTSARMIFHDIFGAEANAVGAPGWQANAISREAYDRAGFLYSSDTRGTEPYFPKITGKTFRTLEIPTTLPTLDELMGRPEYPEHMIVPHLLSLLKTDRLNVFTLHAELEGMGKRDFFRTLLTALRARGVEVITMEHAARECLAHVETIPVCTMAQGSVDGRSGTLALQGPVFSQERSTL